MPGILTNVRLRTVAGVTVLLVGAAIAVAMLSASANALVYANDISLRVVNNTAYPLSAAYCPNGHVSIKYKFGTASNPCNVTPFVTTLAPRGGRWPEGAWPNNPNPYTANPLGVVVKIQGKTLYFYASNPIAGKPFFEANGQKVEMVEGELRTVQVDGVEVRFHREGDLKGGLTKPSYKVMTIEIVKA